MIHKTTLECLTCIQFDVKISLRLVFDWFTHVFFSGFINNGQCGHFFGVNSWISVFLGL